MDFLQSIHSQTDGAADQGSIHCSRNDGASQTTAFLERRHFYMKEKNKARGSE